MDPVVQSYETVRDSRRRATMISLAAVIVVALIISVAIGVVVLNGRQEEYVPVEDVEGAFQTLCDTTLYPDSCKDTSSSYLRRSSRRQHKELLQTELMLSMMEIQRASAVASRLLKQANDQNLGPALQDCVQLIDITHDQINSSISLLQLAEVSGTSYSDMRTWLSAVITNMETCHDGILEKSDGKSTTRLVSRLYTAKVHASNSLSILVKIIRPDPSNKLLVPSYSIRNELPSWVSAEDRRLLQSSANDVNADVVVAADGSGNFKTITQAIDAAPEKRAQRYVIKVRKGTYKEYIEVGKKKINIMLVGEGMENTIITGSRNVIDGSTTFNSATFAAVGEGFMAQDIAFINTGGPQKHQAVALRVGSDKSVFYRCKMGGYQDTLYVHSLRQFYRECVVLGTVDFIFGNAAVVLQNSTLLPRKPGDNQKNAITAQGRTDPHQNTGISIHNCKVTADSDLVPVKSSFPTYLGRPWKNYSRTVFMQSYLDDVINPAGWLEWSGDFALSTLYYGEYMNTGAGASTMNRVKWSGYQVIKSPKEASQFTVGEFIQGNEWLESSGVEYIDGLVE